MSLFCQPVFAHVSGVPSLSANVGHEMAQADIGQQNYVKIMTDIISDKNVS